MLTDGRSNPHFPRPDPDCNECSLLIFASSCSLLNHCVPVLGAGAAEVAEAGPRLAPGLGTLRTWPTAIMLGLLIELALCRHCTLVPYVMAMALSVSPVFTVYFPGVAGQPADAQRMGSFSISMSAVQGDQIILQGCRGGLVEPAGGVEIIAGCRAFAAIVWGCCDTPGFSRSPYRILACACARERHIIMLHKVRPAWHLLSQGKTPSTLMCCV